MRNSLNLKEKWIHSDTDYKICTFLVPLTEHLTFSNAFPREFREYFISKNIL